MDTPRTIPSHPQIGFIKKLWILGEMIACSRGSHSWSKDVREKEKYYAKAGVFMGMAQTGQQICKHCKTERSVVTAASLFNLGADNTGWQPLTLERKTVLNEQFSLFRP